MSLWDGQHDGLDTMRKASGLSVLLPYAIHWEHMQLSPATVQELYQPRDGALPKVTAKTHKEAVMS